MPKVFDVNGHHFEFPDEATDEQIQASLPRPQAARTWGSDLKDVVNSLTDSKTPEKLLNSLPGYVTQRLPELLKGAAAGTLESAKGAAMAPGQAYQAGQAGNVPSVESMIGPAANMAAWAGAVPNKFGLTSDIRPNGFLKRPVVEPKGPYSPSEGMLEHARDLNYNSIREGGVTVPETHRAMAPKVQQELYARQVADDSKGIMAMLDTIAKGKGDIPAADLLQAHLDINHGSAPATAKAIAQKYIFDMLDKDAPEVADQLRQGIGNSKALRNSQIFTNAQARGHLVDTSKGYQTQINQLLRPSMDTGTNRFLETLSPELQAEAEMRRTGRWGQRAIRGTGNFFTNNLSPARLAGGWFGYEHGGLPGAIAGDMSRYGIGKVFEGIDNSITRRSMDTLGQMARNESPLYQKLNAPRTPWTPQPPTGLLPPPPIVPPAPPRGIAGEGFTMHGSVPPPMGPNGSSLNPFQGHWPTGPQLALPPPQRLLPPPSGMPMGSRPPSIDVIPMSGGGGLPALRPQTLPAVSQMTGPSPGRRPASTLDSGPGVGGQSDLGRMQMVRDRLRGVLDLPNQKKIVKGGVLRKVRNAAKGSQEDESAK